MISDEDIQKSWDESLVTIPSYRFGDATLPQDTKLFLQTVGLPPEFGINRFPWAVLIQAERFEQLKFQDEDYLVLGLGEFGKKLCINQQNGQVILIQPNSLFDFMNSDISSFVVFLTLFRNIFAKYHEDIPFNKFVE